MTDPKEADSFMKRAEITVTANHENEITGMRQLESVGIEFMDAQRKAITDAAETLNTLPAERGRHATRKDATPTNEDAKRTEEGRERK